ncbi:MAG TPA: CDP-diacylglycerol--serine O-phosphatidyltransferase [Archaeoglobus profundus]|nr:CDP-diacylglycerol--serine O-phosphatidyltransferase [Archaeoglobus profundus]
MKIFKELSIADIFSILNATSGFLGVSYLLTKGYSENIFHFLYFSAIMDGLDGLTANKLGKKGKLGKDLDTLADLISFGVFPSTVLVHVGYLYSALLYLLATILRLARFNVLNKRDFVGLPTVASALLISSVIIINIKFVQIVAIILSILMISDIEYKRIGVRSSIVCGIVILTCFFIKNAILILFILTIIYIVSPGVVSLVKRILKQE